MKLYYHKTDGGAEYLTDKYIVCPNGEKEGVFEGATIIVRLDGEPELTCTVNNNHEKLIAACLLMWGELGVADQEGRRPSFSLEELQQIEAAIAGAEKG